MQNPFSCSSLERRLYHFQADELPEAEREALLDHVDGCERCARRLAVEDALLATVKSRLKRSPVPAGLGDRVREVLRRESEPAGGPAGWLRRSWFLPLAASLVLGLALFAGLGGLAATGRGRVAGVVHVDREVTVVDLECDRAGRSLESQRRCTAPDHLNALKVAPGRYWNLSLDRPASRRLAADGEMRGHRLLVEGDLYTRIQTLHLTGYSDLGLGGRIAKLSPGTASR